MTDFYHVILLQLLVILGLLQKYGIESLQCYSCKATGTNELDANIKCLENAYLENCEEFYDYYNEIEDQDVISYEYYYYDKEDDNKESDTSNAEGTKRTNEVGPAKGSRDRSTNISPPPARREDLNPSRRNKRAVDKKEKETDKKKEENEVGSFDDEYEPEYYYDYEYVDDNVTSTKPSKFNDLDISAGKTKDKDDKKSDKKKEDAKSKSKKTMDPQHYCYSTAFKSSWESYTVEKGCKKISYCKNSVEKKPEWAHPWNFCCDRSRCNVKLVKDKPQRVFGMGCRRQDDCIQGHISRALCPHYFKSCPRISSSMIKMECRVKARTMGTVKNGAKYRHQFREKKCYCAKGYYPRGPICTSGALHLSGLSHTILGHILVSFFIWIWH